MYKVAKGISQNSGSFHQAPTEFFLRHCESEHLWLLNSPKTGRKVSLEKIHQPKPKERKLFENCLTGVSKVFIMVNSLSLSKFYENR